MGTIIQPIVFFGTEDFSLVTLRALVESGHTIAAVVTKPDSPKGRGQVLTKPLVKQFAQSHSIPVWQPQKMYEITANIQSINNPIGVLVSFGKIIPQTTIDLFTPGIINIHPSLLPLYRGPSPIETAIANGDTQTGVSIMQLDAKMDAGPVYAQKTIPLHGTEYASDLYDVLGNLGSALLIDILPQISDGSLQPTRQVDQAASYCRLITKADGTIDWSNDSQMIERSIRAYHQWPQSRTVIHGIDVIITSAGVLPDTSATTSPGTVTATSSSLSIKCKTGQIELLAIKPIGKKEMPIQAFLSGYSSKFTRNR